MRRHLPTVRFVALAAVLAGCREAGSTIGREPAGSDFDPVGGALSGRIAFLSIRPSGGGSGIYVMKADGSEQPQFTTVGGSPAWSPDGGRIAFNRDLEIFVMNADGSGEANLTNNAAVDLHPAWSPDGAQIAFVSSRDGDGCGIHVMNADGTGVTSRLTEPDQCDLTAAWSPDGRKIAFENYRQANFRPEIYVMNADGSGQTNLTHYAGFDSAPAWSPDGSRIAFIRDADQGGKLFVMKADGSGATQVTTNGPVGSQSGRIAWSPDGRRIAYEGFRDAIDQIFVAKVDQSGETQQLTTIGNNIQPAWTWRRQ